MVSNNINKKEKEMSRKMRECCSECNRVLHEGEGEIIKGERVACYECTKLLDEIGVVDSCNSDIMTIDDFLNLSAKKITAMH